jgi:hypothetical protein
VLFLAAGLVLLWAGLVLATLASAASDVRSGRDVLKRVRREDRISNVLNGSVGGDLRSAERRLARAEHRLSNPILLPLSVLPVVGRQLDSLESLAKAGNELAAAGAEGVSEADRIVHRPLGSPADRLVLIREVGDLAARTRRRLDAISLGPREGLVSPLAKGHNDMAALLADVSGGLDRAASGTKVFADWLEGPRRYLLFAANNAEMRAGSGMFLSVGVLQSMGGQLSVDGFRTVFDVPVPPGAVPFTGDFADRWGWLHP